MTASVILLLLFSVVAADWIGRTGKAIQQETRFPEVFGIPPHRYGIKIDVQPVEECSFKKGEIRQWVVTNMLCCDPAKDTPSTAYEQCEWKRESYPPYTLIELRFSTNEVFKGRCDWNMTDDPKLGRTCPDDEMAIAWRVLRIGDYSEKRFCCRFSHVDGWDYLYTLKNMNCHWMKPSTDRYVKCDTGFTDYYRNRYYHEETSWFGYRKTGAWFTDLLCCKFMRKQ